MFFSCLSLSLSRNSIYSIHFTFYSLAVSGLLSTFFMITFLFLSNSLVIYFGFIFIFIWFSFFILVFFLFMWINDFLTECSFSFTRTEQHSLVYGIKLLILSEFMLFFSVFWSLLNFRFILNVFSCFYALPLLCSFCFAIPYSNVIVLLFSSLPIQATIIFYKVGLFFCIIEQLGQTVSCGTVFLVLQLKEFFYSFHSITDCMIGSIFYFSTGLHGAHVLFGLFYFVCILMLYFTSFYTSFSLSLSLSLLFLIQFYLYCTSQLYLNYIYFILFYLNLYIKLLNTWLYSSPLLISFAGVLDSWICRIGRRSILMFFGSLDSILISWYLWTASINNPIVRTGSSVVFYLCSSLNLILFFLIFLKYILFLTINHTIAWLWTCFTCKTNKHSKTCQSSKSRVHYIKYSHSFTLYWVLLFINYSRTALSWVYSCQNHINLILNFYWIHTSIFVSFYIEYSESLIYSSLYWHFVDIIWVVVFILYFYLTWSALYFDQVK